MDEKWHGTAGGYSNHRCRCDDCRLAWNDACAKRRRRKRSSYVYREEGDHGTMKEYGRGCSCPECKQANSEYSRQLYRGEKSRVGFCEICEGESDLVWDHDHVTGGHRGWICLNCNHGLGLFQDSISILERATQWVTD